MHRIFRGLVGTILVALAVLAAVVAFDAPAKPTALASVSDPFDKVDFSDVPLV